MRNGRRITNVAYEKGSKHISILETRLIILRKPILKREGTLGLHKTIHNHSGQAVLKMCKSIIRSRQENFHLPLKIIADAAPITPKKGAYAGAGSVIFTNSRVFTGAEDSVELFYT